MKPVGVRGYMNSRSRKAPTSLSCSDLKNSRLQKLSMTVMPTSSSRNVRIELSSAQADHFSSERKKGRVRCQASFTYRRRPIIVGSSFVWAVKQHLQVGEPGVHSLAVHAEIGIPVHAA